MGSEDGVEFRILGPLEVLRGDTPIDLGGAKQGALIVILLLHANDVVFQPPELRAASGQEEHRDRVADPAVIVRKDPQGRRSSG
jgi:hypothetical protein